MTRQLLLPLVLTLALTGTLRAQTISADSAAVLLERGKTLFEGKGNCVSCHGKGGVGNLGPTTALTGVKNWLHTKGTKAEIVELIRTGVPQEKSKSVSAMPPKGGMRLSEVEIELLAGYVLELHKKKG